MYEQRTVSKLQNGLTYTTHTIGSNVPKIRRYVQLDFYRKIVKCSNIHRSETTDVYQTFKSQILSSFNYHNEDK